MVESGNGRDHNDPKASFRAKASQRKGKQKEPEVSRHTTTIDAHQFTGHLADLVREAGGGKNKSDKEIVENAAEDHFRIIEEANRTTTPGNSTKGRSSRSR